MHRPRLRIFGIRRPAHGPLGRRLALAAAVLGGSVLAGIVVAAPVASAFPAGGGIPVPGASPIPFYGECASPAAPSLAPAPADRIFFSSDYLDEVQLAGSAPLSTNPNAGCGPVTYEVFGWSGASSPAQLVSTASVLSDGSLLFDVPSVPGGSAFNFYVQASGTTGSSVPSNVVAITLPSLVAITSAQEAQGLLAAGDTLYFNWPGVGLARVSTPQGPSGPWQDPNGQPLPAGTGILQTAAPPTQ